MIDLLIEKNQRVNARLVANGLKDGLGDLNKLDIDELRRKLERAYAIFSYGGCLRYQSGIYKFLQDEFHPLWHTLTKCDDHFELKVNIRTFNWEYEQLESSDFIWFDVKIKSNYIEATCQLAPKIKFLILGSRDTKFYRKMVPELFSRLSA